MYLILKSGVTVIFDTFEQLIAFMAVDPEEVIGGYIGYSVSETVKE